MTGSLAIGCIQRGVVRSVVGLFTSLPTDDPGAPAAWLPVNGMYLFALFTCRKYVSRWNALLSLPAHRNAPKRCASVNGETVHIGLRTFISTVAEIRDKNINKLAVGGHVFQLDPCNAVQIRMVISIPN